MKETLVFIASEDSNYNKRLSDIISGEGINIVSFTKGEELIDALYKKPSIIFFSNTMSEMSGSVLIKKIKRFNPAIAKIIIAPTSRDHEVLQLVALGAVDFIYKETDSDERIKLIFDNTLQKMEYESELVRLRHELGKKYKYNKVLRGKSEWIKELYALLDKAAKTSIPVSLTGEAGTGKKLIAKTIHFHSAYANNPFVEVDISVVPEKLIENEFFGSERKSIMYERDIVRGKLEEAQRGTLYIKDIHKMTPQMQSKFSDVLRNKEFYRINGETALKFNSRIIIASEEELLEAVKKGTFREGLYYRLLGLPIRVAPLRERNNDVMHLSRFFLNEFCKENGIEKLEISPSGQEKLFNYPYPGNIRELKAVIELAAVMSDGKVIEADHINFFSINTMANLLLKENTLNEYSRQIIKSFMDKYDDNIMVVAQKLDIGKSTIYRLKKNNEI
ncbi:MAG: sigma-54 dependent transcriptional regulator [Bacteroidales bacterium]|nr:sigma-54 dependent transcriptional regulator [Bacteroidales bacterium]